MAYKFQLGNARLSGSLVQEGKIDMVGNLDDDAQLTLNDGTNDLAVLDMDGNGAARLQMDNQDNETTIVFDNNSKAGRARFYADGGTVVQASIDAGAISGSATISGHALDIESTGNFEGVVTAGGFTIGSAQITEAELEMIDGITAGTAAASKAVVLDGSKNIATIGTIGCGAITSTGASSFAGGITPAAANGAALGSAAKEWADLYLADGSVIYMGNSQDVTMTHSANEGIVLEATNDGGSNPTSINLRLSSSSPADNDEIAAINFSGYNDNEQPEVFAQIKSKATDVSDGSEDGSLIFSTFVNGSPTQMFDLSSTTVGAATFHTDVTISGSTPFLTIGDSGAEDCGVLLNSSGSGMSGIDYYMAIDYSYNSNNGAFMIGAGTKGRNQYGEDPLKKKNKRNKKKS